MLHSARGFRGEPTEGEAAFWALVRDRRLGPKFRRQHPLKGFVVDFCCAEHRLVVEIDGGVHNGREVPDAARSAVLVAAGYRVLRFTNYEVLYGVDEVLRRLATALSSPLSTSCGEGGRGGEVDCDAAKAAEANSIDDAVVSETVPTSSALQPRPTKFAQVRGR